VKSATSRHRSFAAMYRSVPKPSRDGARRAKLAGSPREQDLPCAGPSRSSAWSPGSRRLRRFGPATSWSRRHRRPRNHARRPTVTTSAGRCWSRIWRAWVRRSPSPTRPTAQPPCSRIFSGRPSFTRRTGTARRRALWARRGRLRWRGRSAWSARRVRPRHGVGRGRARASRPLDDPRPPGTKVRSVAVVRVQPRRAFQPGVDRPVLSRAIAGSSRAPAIAASTVPPT
jgi:hypothetical protein